MITDVAKFLAWVFAPLIWLCVAALLVLGITGLAAPERLRRAVKRFTSNTPVRLLGGVLMIIGTEMFVHARFASMPVLVKTLGVLLFVDGGVRLFIPTVSIIFAEWLVTLSAKWYRLLGFLALVVAYLFYLASKLPASV